MHGWLRRALVALLVGVVSPASASRLANVGPPASSAAAEIWGSASGILTSIPAERAGLSEAQRLEVPRGTRCLYDQSASDISNDPINHRDPTGRRFVDLTQDQKAALAVLLQHPIIGPAVEILAEADDILIRLLSVPKGRVAARGGATTIYFAGAQREEPGLVSANIWPQDEAAILYNVEDYDQYMMSVHGLGENSLVTALAHELGELYFKYVHYGQRQELGPRRSSESPNAPTLIFLGHNQGIQWENFVRSLDQQRPYTEGVGESLPGRGKCAEPPSPLRVLREECSANAKSSVRP